MRRARHLASVVRQALGRLSRPASSMCAGARVASYATPPGRGAATRPSGRWPSLEVRLQMNSVAPSRRRGALAAERRLAGPLRRCAARRSTSSTRRWRGARIALAPDLSISISRSRRLRKPVLRARAAPIQNRSNPPSARPTLALSHPNERRLNVMSEQTAKSSVPSRRKPAERAETMRRHLQNSCRRLFQGPTPLMMRMAATLVDKIWSRHVVRELSDGRDAAAYRTAYPARRHQPARRRRHAPALVTGGHFSDPEIQPRGPVRPYRGKTAGRPARNQSVRPRAHPRLRANAREFGVTLYDVKRSASGNRPRHRAGAPLRAARLQLWYAAQPQSPQTNGALGALAWGIGTTR